jgi:hypothetical protein
MPLCLPPSGLGHVRSEPGLLFLDRLERNLIAAGARHHYDGVRVAQQEHHRCLLSREHCEHGV